MEEIKKLAGMESFMEENIVVSVIVPVYNREKYLESCLDSILKQTCQNFEIIVVDDGSTDASGTIMDAYAECHKNIRVIHKENAGVTLARLAGIQITQSEYISFVDSDDWLEEDFLSSLSKDIRKYDADLVASGCIIEKGGISKIQQNKILPGLYEGSSLETTFYAKMLCYETFFEFGIQPYLWNKIYKKALLLDCFAGLDPTIYDGEDAAVLFPYLLKVKRVVVKEYAKYHYRIHPECVTSVKKADFYENAAKLYLHLNQKFKQTKFYNILLPQLDQYLCMMIKIGNPDALIKTEKKIFPFDKIRKGSKIVLYGAGHIGKLYFYQISQLNYCEVIAWVDRGKSGEMICETQIVTMEEALQLEYDFVVIALTDAVVVEQVKKDLIGNGVLEKQVIM